MIAWSAARACRAKESTPTGSWPSLYRGTEPRAAGETPGTSVKRVCVEVRRGERPKEADPLMLTSFLTLISIVPLPFVVIVPAEMAAAIANAAACIIQVARQQNIKCIVTPEQSRPPANADVSH